MTRPSPWLAPSLPGVQYPSDYGARFDGSHDDTKAIQTALDYGGLVMLWGTPKVTAPLLVRRMGTTVAGLNRGLTVLNVGHSDGAVFKGADPATRYNHVTFRDFAIDAASARTGLVGLDLTRMSYTTVRDVAVTLRGSGSVGIGVDHADDGTGPYYCNVDNFVFSGGGHADNCGIRFGRSGHAYNRTANAWKIDGGRIAACGIGIDLQGASHTVVGLTLESVSGIGVKIGDDDVANSSVGAKLYGVGHEGTSTATYVDIASTSSEYRIEPGYVTGVAQKVVDRASRGVVEPTV